MAYDQSYTQRPYNGPAAQRPRPPPSQQQYQYPQQGYDQYQNDGYEGYGQDYNGDSNDYQDVNGGGRGNGYAPSNQNYPPQQEYYGESRGGGQMQPPNRGGGGNMPRAPHSDGMRGNYNQQVNGQGRGYPPPGQGRAGRPAPLARNPSSDPGAKAVRRPLITPPMSPPDGAPSTWDSPFPTFPGTKAKTSLDEERAIVQKMAAMEVGQPSQNRPRTAGSKGSQDRYAASRSGTGQDYGRPSLDSQRSMPRGPARVNPDPRRQPPGPAPGPGYGRQDGSHERGFSDRGGYSAGPVSPMHDNFGPPGRSMTMPNQPPMGNQAGRAPPMSLNSMQNERPYNGPVGRVVPQRPSTASGMRQPPQRIYPNQAPVQQPQQYLGDPYANVNPDRESVSDLYDSYYEPPEHQSRHIRTQSHESEMPNFDLVAANTAGQRGSPFDARNNPQVPQGQSFDQQNSYPKHVGPDPRSRTQPQAAVFEMAGDYPGDPNAYQQDYPEDRYNQSDQYNIGLQHGGQRVFSAYQQPPPSQNQLPPRSASAAPGQGLPNGPKSGFVGLPNNRSPQNGGMAGPNGMPQLNQDALPAHPPPVRAGLVPNSVPNMAAKPAPVRNYNNVNPGPSAVVPPPQASTPRKVEGAAPVTPDELENLRTAYKNNPADQTTMMTLARKLVEAAEVLAPKIVDQKLRNKMREKYIMDAHKILKKLVANQNTEAMFYLADCYGRGALGLESDNKEAFTLYQSAAKNGHPAAAYRTAVCCELGNDEGGGTRKDPLKAMQWYKRAATLGDPPAMYKMGMIQLKGLLGQPKNPREAIGWLKRAAERADSENPHALHELGLLYEAPQGPDGSIMRDEQYSFTLFQQAANLGYKFSQFRLGTAYEYGLFGCPIDPRQSIMWYSRAAVQEEHQAELALSGWYLTGSEGILQQSDTEAYLWARKAAVAGNAKAEYAMGYFTESGIGIPANLEDAKRWYWRAAAQNFPKARERLEELKRGGKGSVAPGRDRISRSKVGKAQEGECAVM